MAYGRQSKLASAARWATIIGAIGLAWYAGLVLAALLVLTAAYLAWQLMKGAPLGRSALMPAGLWGGGIGLVGGIEAQQGVVEIAVNAVGFAILGLIAIWLLGAIIRKM